MATNAQKLIEFAIKLIDIQIKKYQKLVQIGVGPDAKMNAVLVRKQVLDLLDNLGKLLQTPKQSEKELLRFASLMKFYLDCEFLRGRAGWLLDENKIHNVEYDRVTDQFQELKELRTNLSIERTYPTRLTDQQQQCLHDSHEIAFLILDLAIKLKENPEGKNLGDSGGFGHGFKIMKKHAKAEGRYHRPDISKEIAKRHKGSKEFLQHSRLRKSTAELNKDDALTCLAHDRRVLQKLLNTFLRSYPDSDLSRSDFEWYMVAKKKNKSEIKSQPWGLKEYGLFATGVLVAGVSVAASCRTMFE